MQISTPRPVHQDVALRYHMKNRFNPIYAAERIVQLGTRRKFFLIGIIAILSFSLLTGIIIWFLIQDSSLGRTERTLVTATPCLLLGSLCIRLIASICRELAEEKALAEKIDLFEERYNAFLETIGLTPINIHPLSDRKIEKLCEDLLGSEARATASKSPRTKKVRQKRLVDIYETVTRIGYGKKSLEDYVKRAGRKPRVKKASSRRATA